MEVREDLYGIQVPRKYLANKTTEQCQAEGVLAAEKMIYETPPEYHGKVALEFTGWTLEVLPWQVAEIQEFCKGFLWGHNTRDGKITAHFAQQVLALMYDEAQDPAFLFGKYQLVATVFQVPRKKSIEKGKVFYSLHIETVDDYIQDIESEDVGDAKDHWISLYAKVKHIVQFCEGKPYLMHHKTDGPLIVQLARKRESQMLVAALRTPPANGLAFYKTKELCAVTSQVEGFEPTQFEEGDILALLAEAYFRGYPGIEIWRDEQTLRQI